MILAALTILVIIGAFFIGPVSQNPEYHNFADQMTLWTIPNFFNVMSNLGFIFVGIWGIGKYRTELTCETYKLPYLAFCFGVILTAIGSGWYHLFPDNQSLVWDRLPMTLAFMSLFSLVIRDFVNEALGKSIFIPALLFGAGSILSWLMSEQAGAGDLRAYGVVQFLPLLLFPFILIFYKPKSGSGWYLVMALLFYLSAKGAEYLDGFFYQIFGHGLSGHSLKHILAAVGSFYALKIFLKVRRA